jgi:hypothetical protein
MEQFWENGNDVYLKVKHGLVAENAAHGELNLDESGPKIYYQERCSCRVPIIDLTDPGLKLNPTMKVTW